MSSRDPGTRSNAPRWALWSIVGIAVAGIVPLAERALSGGAIEAAAPPANAKVRFAAIQFEQPLHAPPGRFRLAHPDTLRDIRLPLSHIVISHRDSAPLNGVSYRTDLRMSEWQGRFSRRAPRSRDEALVIARKVEAELIARPSSFEALAVRYSDDPLTKDLGGRLGVLPLDEVPVVMQDAANLLRPGEISPLIESTTGFHLVKLDDAPKAQRVGGQRIVIGYAGSLAGPPPALPGLPSRDDALAAARAIVKEARTRPEALLEIARRRAAPDAIATGKTGVWSSRDASRHTTDGVLELAELSRLEPLEISEPVDGPYGWQIFQRLSERDAQLAPLAYEAVLFRVDPKAAPDSEYARDRVRAQASAALRELEQDPSRLPDLQRRFCCAGIVQHRPGWNGFEIAALLSRVKVGEVVPELWEQPNVIGLLKRVEPTPEPERLASAFELPRPAAADLGVILTQGRGVDLAQAARDLGREAQKDLALGAEGPALGALLDQLALQLEPSNPGPERRAMLDRTLVQARELLGPERFGRFMAYMNEWIVQRVLTGK